MIIIADMDGHVNQIESTLLITVKLEGLVFYQGLIQLLVSAVQARQGNVKIRTSGCYKLC